MNKRKTAAVFAVAMGASMVGIWTMFYFTNSIPELEAKPMEIGMHLLAEAMTAISLIIGGIGLFIHKSWGRNVYLLSMGMLFYTLVNSSGYYMQLREPGFVIMFAVFLVLSFAAAALVLSEGKGYTSNPLNMDHTAGQR